MSSGSPFVRIRLDRSRDVRFFARRSLQEEASIAYEANLEAAHADDDKTESSDEEMVKKRRKLRQGADAVAKDRDSKLQDDPENRRQEEADSEVTSSGRKMAQ